MAYPVDFKEVNFNWGGYETEDNSPNVMDLKSYRSDTESISCWKLSFLERLVVLLTGKVWLRILLGRHDRLQPQAIEGRSPFTKTPYFLGRKRD